MKRFVWNPSDTIPEIYISDCKRLRRFIRDNLDIEISLIDTFRLWSSISESWSASWLSIDSHYYNMPREEFLSYEMEKRGYLVEDL